MKKFLLAGLALGLGYLAFWPVPVAPKVYEPLKAPGFTGDFEANDAMSALDHVLLPDGAVGPEDLAVMPDGTIYTTDLAGGLYRIDGPTPQKVEDLGGRQRQRLGRVPGFQGRQRAQLRAGRGKAGCSVAFSYRRDSPDYNDTARLALLAPPRADYCKVWEMENDEEISAGGSGSWAWLSCVLACAGRPKGL